MQGGNEIIKSKSSKDESTTSPDTSYQGKSHAESTTSDKSISSVVVTSSSSASSLESASSNTNVTSQHGKLSSITSSAENTRDTEGIPEEILEIARSLQRRKERQEKDHEKSEGKVSEISPTLKPIPSYRAESSSNLNISSCEPSSTKTLSAKSESKTQTPKLPPKTLGSNPRIVSHVRKTSSEPHIVTQKNNFTTDSGYGNLQQQCQTRNMTAGEVAVSSLNQPRTVSESFTRSQQGPTNTAMVMPPGVITNFVQRPVITSTTVNPQSSATTMRKPQISSSISFSPTLTGISTNNKSNIVTAANVPSSSFGLGGHRRQNRPRANSDTVTSRSSALNSPQVPLRRGKWTVEEEEYVARVIRDFNTGYLNAPAGTTLRTYLSEKLHCDPMRITKKFTGGSCIGKRVFHPTVRCGNNAEEIDRAQAELMSLEKRWRRRLEMQQREASKKSAVLSPSMSNPSYTHHLGTPHGGSASSSGNHTHQPARYLSSGQHIVAQTATWLDRANSVLAASASNVTSATTTGSIEVENQMKEVQQLIYEGPSIQKSSAGLTHLIQSAATTQPPPSQAQHAETDIDHQNNVVDRNSHKSTPLHQQGSSSLSPSVLPTSKRPRRSSSENNLIVNADDDSSSPSASITAGKEDVEALVGFLNSVRRESSASIRIGKSS